MGQSGHIPNKERPGDGGPVAVCSPATDSAPGLAPARRQMEQSGGAPYYWHVRRNLFMLIGLYLLLAAGTWAAEAMELGGSRLRCGCEGSCSCTRPGEQGAYSGV